MPILSRARRQMLEDAKKLGKGEVVKKKDKLKDEKIFAKLRKLKEGK